MSSATARASRASRPQQAKSTGAALLAAAATAFAVRLAVVLATRSYLFQPPVPIADPAKAQYHFGFEFGHIARSIVEGRGYGSPFVAWTGPTAWYAPVYTYLLAGVFKVFGVYTAASGVAILALNSLFAALTCIPVFFLAERAAGRKVALWAAWLWALTPVFFEFATKWAWETSLSALLLLAALWVAARLGEGGGWRDWFGAGVLWGVIALANTSLLSMMPFALAWSWWRSRERARTPGFLLAFAVMFLTVFPWMVRNHAVLGRWIFVRDNFWAEMRFGNAEQSRGIWLGWMHPETNDLELAHYREVGELRYIDEKKTEVLDFIRHRPGFFAELCVRRAVLFWANVPTDWSETLSAHEVLRDQWWIISFSALAWAGLVEMIRRRSPLAWLFAPALLVYPCLYYLASADARYRHPIEPVMLILALYAISAARPRRRHSAAASSYAAGPNGAIVK